MQRYFLQPEQLTGDRVTITGDDAHHLIKVMRAEPGDEIICTNGLDREVLAKVTAMDKSSVEAEVLQELAMDREAAVQVWIAQSLPKGDKLELVIQKCTELGAAGILPFVSERTVVQYDEKKEGKRLERWRKIAKEAAEQSHRNRIPAIEAPCTWKQLMKMCSDFDLTLLCYEKESGLQLRPLLASAVMDGPTDRLPKVLVLVGPEGGFTVKEAEEALSAGCHSVSLGKRILRAETAGMAALTCILYEYGEMGG